MKYEIYNNCLKNIGDHFQILPSPNAEYRDPSTDYGDPQQSGWF